MTKNKSIMLMSLICLCLLCVCTIGAFASDDSYAEENVTVTENGLTFQLIDGESGKIAKLTNTGSLSGEITVPATVNYRGVPYPVADSDSFSGNNNVTKVVFLGEMSKIPSEIFSNCTGIVNVEFFKVGSIGDKAFYRCTSLTDVKISGDVKDIGTNAFYGCSSLKSMKLSGVVNIGSNAFYNSALETIDVGTGVETIGSSAFYGTRITSFNLPDLKAINGSFNGMKLLVEVNAPSVTSVKSNAFYQCASLEKVKLSDKVTEFNSTNAFSGCNKLTSLVIGFTDSAMISNGAFASLKIENTILSDTKVIYVPRTATSFTIPDGTVEICHSAFRYGIIETITIPSTVKTIGMYAFADCTALKAVTIEGNGLESLQSYAFKGCKSLTDMILPDSVTEVGSYAINETKLSKSVILNLSGVRTLVYLSVGSTIPDDVVCIGSRSIPGGIDTLTIPASVRTLSSYAFSGSTLKDVTIPATVEVMDNYTFAQCTSLKEVEFESGITYLPAYCFSGCTGLEKVTIPDSVSALNNNVFYNCSSLGTIIVPASVKTIGGSAFYGCKSLTSVDIKGNPDITGASVFNGCSSLASINLWEGIGSIQSNMFRNCTKLSSITIPSTVESIGSYAFNGCGLKSITLPASVKVIDSSSFASCASLESVTIRGTHVDIKGSAFSNCTNIKTLDIYGMLKLTSSSFSNVTGIENLIIHTSVPLYNDYLVSALASITAVENGVKTVSVTYDNGTPVKGKMIISTGSTLVLGDDIVATTFSCLDTAVSGKSISVSPGNKVFSIVGDTVVSGNVLIHAGNGTSDLSIAKGVVSAAPYSFSVSGASVITLPAGMTDVLSNAFVGNTAVRNIMINSDVQFASDSGIESSVKFFKNSIVDVVTGDLPLYGVFTVVGDSTVIMEMNDIHASISVITDGTAIAFSVTPDNSYNRSKIVVKNGDVTLNLMAADSETKIGENSVAGMYYISSVAGDTKLSITGIELNRYGVTYPADMTGFIMETFGGSKDIPHSNKISFSVLAKPGYVIEGISVTSNAVPLTPTSTLNGLYCYSIEVTDDIEIAISGIVPDRSFTVTFDTDGGTAVDPKTVYNGMTVGVPVTEKPGYIIEGWYTDSSKTVAYDFAAPVIADMTLYAKWVVDTSSMVTVVFSGDNGAVSAIINGYREIASGTKVPAGSNVMFVYDADLRYEFASWVVNGNVVESAGPMYAMSVASDVTVKATSIYLASTPYVNHYDSYTPVNGHYSNIWNSGKGNTTGAQFTGMTYLPAIMGGYAYAKVDNYLEKIDIETGVIVKTVKTADSYSGFYNYTCTGNGLILDCLTGKVFDQDLEQVFSIGSTSARSYYYDQKFFVATKDGTFCYSAVDADTKVSDNVHKPLWNVKVDQVVSNYEGSSTMFFFKDYMYGVAMVNKVISLITLDVDTGALIDTVTIPEFEGKSINTGYMDFNEGYATITAYGAGIFDSTSPESIINIASVKIDDNGYFNRASLRAISSNTGNSYCSALIVEGGLGYVFASGVFQVYDMETMKLLASSSKYSAGGSNISSHGSMAITTGHSGKVIGYVIPYNSSKDLCVFEYTISTNTLESYMLKDAAITSQYASGQVRIAENGYILWVNDSGTMFCIAPTNDVTIVYPDGNSTVLKVIEGKTLAADPAISGYYTDEACKNAFDLSTAITDELKLYVKLSEWYVDDGTLHVVDGSVMSDLGTADQPWRSEAFTKVIIEDGVTSIGANAFYGFIGIEEVIVPGTVRTIGANAFYGCIALDTFTYTSGFDSVDVSAFSGCISLMYSVRFVSDGDTYAEVIGMPFSTIDVPRDPVREGYTFAGWDVTIPDVMPLKDTIVTAKWNINSYAVTFILDGEVYGTPTLVEYGTEIILPKTPSKATDRVYTYKFSGWEGYTDGMTVSKDVVFNGSIVASERPVDRYSFWLIDSTGEYDSINGWYTADGTDALDAFITAMDTAKISIGIEYSTNGHFFNDSSIGVWSVGSWASDGNLYNPNYAVWNWNETRGWYLGNTFGTDDDKVYIISHERYIDSLYNGEASVEAGYVGPYRFNTGADAFFVYDGSKSYKNVDEAVKAAYLKYMSVYSVNISEFGLSMTDETNEMCDGDEETALFLWFSECVESGTADSSALKPGYDISCASWGWIQYAPQNRAVDDYMDTVFGPSVHEVRFVSEGKTVATSKFAYGETIVLPKDPVKASDWMYSYKFSSWGGYEAGMKFSNESEFIAVFERSFLPTSEDKNTVFESDNGSFNISTEEIEHITETGKTVTIDTGSSNIVFSADSLSTIVSGFGGEMTFTASVAEEGSVTEAQKAVAGDSVLFSIELRAGGRNVHDLGDTVKITVTYGKTVEEGKKVIVYYLDDDGRKTIVDSAYDPVTGKVTIFTNHLSVYMIDEIDDGNGPDIGIYVGIGAVIVVL
ncbi:MAG: leucine-rich repeat protein, partial [Candidatus Methanomethylophilaceae archaeon]|nr:leucine-rich repeat protein [Candidatus Methanomethylophilaceae archaeon]